MRRFRNTVTLLVAFLLQPANAVSWNIPTHMITGSMAFRILQQQSPGKAAMVQVTLEKHPWYAARWRPDLEASPESQRGELLFMLAARWADDIRTKDRAQHRGSWHYINWPFEPRGEQGTVKAKPPEPVNILTAIAANKHVAREAAEPEKRGTALAWLFHLIGDIHQPLNSTQLFTREYPNGDRGGNEICIRIAPGQQAIDLHRLWDGLITSSNNIGQLSKIATDLLSKFSMKPMHELDETEPEGWAKESYEIATKIAYEGGSLRSTPKGMARDCREVSGAHFLVRGYPARAKLIADRRIYLAGYRLADVLQRIMGR